MDMIDRGIMARNEELELEIKEFKERLRSYIHNNRKLIAEKWKYKMLYENLLEKLFISKEKGKVMLFPVSNEQFQQKRYKQYNKEHKIFLKKEKARAKKGSTKKS